MPPVRSFLRSSQVGYTNVSDLTSGHTQDAPMKSLLTNQQILTKSNKSNEKGPKTQGNGTSANYMDLNEFFQKVDKSSDDVSSNHGDLDPDYPKPTVDLLASLLTLGKMIQNQKQLIQRQTKPNVTPSVTSSQGMNNMMDVDAELSNSSRQNTFQSDPLEGFGNIYQETNKGASVSCNSSTYSKRQVVPEDIKDMDYWNRRKRNNLAAKKSREERRKKELEVVETTKQLEKENSQLTLILKRLTSRNEWLESRLQDIRSRRRTDQSIDTSSLSSSAEES